jgi:Cu-Zn family superoxide dismutase
MNLRKICGVSLGCAVIRVAALGLPSAVQAAEPGPAALEVQIRRVSEKGVGEPIGTIKFSEGPAGLEITPSLHGLPAGVHGFHIHENPSCDPKEKDGAPVAALAAGGHYDPHKTGRHGGPGGGGHVGDLPALMVDADGTAHTKMELHGVRLADIVDRSVMIHAGGDNFSDTPAPLGGGGARIACGVVVPSGEGAHPSKRQ